jgi:twitching motility protein PilT
MNDSVVSQQAATAVPRVAQLVDEQFAAPTPTITDLALSMSDPANSFCFSGGAPQPLPGEYKAYCKGLQARCVAVRKESATRIDFTVAYENISWRVHYDKQSIDGEWFRCRRMPKSAPHLGEGGLPSRLPKSICDVLLHPELKKGGLIYVCGATGSGKTTTAAAIVRSRLETFGGMAYTVEDPPEHPLNGWHKGANGLAGYCAQTMVNTEGEGAAGWAESMMSALRSQPAGTPSLLFVGEVRTAQAADVAIQAAGNGFLVIVTGFAADVPSGLQAFLSMLGPERAHTLSYLLRVVIYQKLLGAGSDKSLNAQICVSPDSGSRVATMIASNGLTRLQDEVMRQAHTVRTGGDLWKAAGGNGGGGGRE